MSLFDDFFGTDTDDARKALADAWAYVETLDQAEVSGSVLCLLMDTLQQAVIAPTVGNDTDVVAVRRRVRVAVTLHVLVALHRRTEALTGHPGTHGHCNGFHQVLTETNRKVLAALSGSGGRP